MTTVTLIPSSDFETSGTITGGATAAAVLADGSDSTYVVCDGSGFFSVTMSGAVFPAGAVARNATVRYRATGAAVGAPILRLNQRFEDPVQYVPQDLYVSSGIMTGYSFSVGTVTPLARYNTLRYEVSRVAGSPVINVAKLSLDLTYVEQPVVTVNAVSPDPFGASTVPLSWSTVFDADGGSQTRALVKVVDEATYNAPGFDIETEPLDRLLSGPATSTTVDLPNGTWRAYVQTAQTVNGSFHWSEWSFDEFEVAVTPTVVTVATAADDAAGAIDVTVNRDGGSPGWEFVEVQRSVDGGATWADVRFATYVDATGDADEFVVADHEVPNGQTVTHRARASYLDGSDLIVGTWASSPSTSWSSSDVWFKNVADPSQNVAVCLRQSPSATYGNRRGVFRVIGRSTPVVVSDTFTASTSNLIACLADTLADTADLISLIRSASVLTIVDRADMPDGLRYVSVGSLRRVPAQLTEPAPEQWIELAEVVETDAPVDSSAGR